MQDVYLDAIYKDESASDLPWSRVLVKLSSLIVLWGALKSLQSGEYPDGF